MSPPSKSVIVSVDGINLSSRVILKELSIRMDHIDISSSKIMSSRSKHIKEYTYFNETNLFLSVLENRNLFLSILISSQRTVENRLRTEDNSFELM